MKTTLKTSISNLFSRMSKHAQQLSALLAALAAIVGALIGGFHILSSAITSGVTAQLDSMSTAHSADIAELKESAVRTELLLLIFNTPEDKVAIEMMAKVYFVELNGNHYMMSVYGEWATKYGGDTSFLLR